MVSPKFVLNSFRLRHGADEIAAMCAVLCDAPIDAGVRADDLTPIAEGPTCARCVIEGDRRGYE
jgi:hypothetical protein